MQQYTCMCFPPFSPERPNNSFGASGGSFQNRFPDLSAVLHQNQRTRLLFSELLLWYAPWQAVFQSEV